MGGCTHEFSPPNTLKPEEWLRKATMRVDQCEAVARISRPPFWNGFGSGYFSKGTGKGPKGVGKGIKIRS